VTVVTWPQVVPYLAQGFLVYDRYYNVFNDNHCMNVAVNVRHVFRMMRCKEWCWWLQTLSCLIPMNAHSQTGHRSIQWRQLWATFSLYRSIMMLLLTGNYLPHTSEFSSWVFLILFWLGQLSSKNVRLRYFRLDQDEIRQECSCKYAFLIWCHHLKTTAMMSFRTEKYHCLHFKHACTTMQQRMPVPGL